MKRSRRAESVLEGFSARQKKKKKTLKLPIFLIVMNSNMVTPFLSCDCFFSFLSLVSFHLNL